MSYATMVEIGGGLGVLPGYINLDPVHGEGKFRRRIQEGIPLGDGTVARARASHVLEHIAAGEERIFVFNEVHRVLEHGGIFEVIVPLFSPSGWGWGADPTHVSVWLAQSFDYFTGVITPNAEYGIKPWEMASWTVVPRSFGPEGHALLRKP